MRIALSIADKRNTTCYRKCLFNMKITFLTIFANSSIIIDSVCDIGILLNFRNQDIFANSMNSSGLDGQVSGRITG